MLKCYKSRSNTTHLSAEQCENRRQGYRTFFMLNSTEYEISTAQNNKMFHVLKLSDVVFILLTNVRMPTIVYEQNKFDTQSSWA